MMSTPNTSILLIVSVDQSFTLGSPDTASNKCWTRSLQLEQEMTGDDSRVKAPVGEIDGTPGDHIQHLLVRMADVTGRMFQATSSLKRGNCSVS